MKTTSFLLSIMLIISCRGDYIKTIDKLTEGSWKLKTMTFEDVNGKYKTITESNSTITFFNTTEANNKSGSKLGIQNTDIGKINFTYSLNTSLNIIDLAITQMDKNTLPIDAVGRVQVYHFKFVNSKTIELSIDKEYDFTTKSIIQNCKYTFVRNE